MQEPIVQYSTRAGIVLRGKVLAEVMWDDTPMLLLRYLVGPKEEETSQPWGLIEKSRCRPVVKANA